MIFWGKIWDKIFEKVPHRFLEKFWRKKLADQVKFETTGGQKSQMLSKSGYFLRKS